MKNKMTDLNDHLFMQIERLGDEDLSKKELEKEIDRSKAICEVAGKIIANGALVLSANKFMDNRKNPSIQLPTMLGEGK